MVKELILRHKVHARIIFESSVSDNLERPRIQLSRSQNYGGGDEFLVELRSNIFESSWHVSEAAELSVERIISELNFPMEIPYLESTSIYRVRWLSRTGSGARMDFIFNRSDKKISFRYGLGGVLIDSEPAFPFTINPYGVLVSSSRNGVIWEEFCDLR